MKKILIIQRLDKIGPHKESRDNLDTRLTKLVFDLGYAPILFPNNIDNFKKYLKTICPQGLIISGGGDCRKKDKRFYNEKILINYSIKKKFLC